MTGVSQVIHERGHAVVPSFLYTKLTEFVGPLPEVYDLGCGTVNPVAYWFCEGLSKVYLVDPNAKVRDVETGIEIAVNPEQIYEGLPAIAMHPGFSLREDFYGIPSWRTTLRSLKPKAICFCAYSPDEMTRELEYLETRGYAPVTVEANERFRIDMPLYPGTSYCDTWAIVTRRV